MKRHEIEVGGIYRSYNKIVTIVNIEGDYLEYLVIKKKINRSIQRKPGNIYRCKILSFMQNFTKKIQFELGNLQIW